MNINEEILQTKTIIDTPIKGVTGRILWYVLSAWTSIIVAIMFNYFSLKDQFHDSTLEQSKTDAIQDLRIDGIKRDIELQTLQIKDLNERFNEMQAQQKSNNH
jgi:hypothetical protein